MGEATGILISIIIVSGVIVGLMAFASDIFDNYDVSYDDLTYMNKTSEYEDSVSDVKDSIESADATGIAWIDLPLTFVAGAYSALKLLLNIPQILISIVMEASYIIGIPAWVTGMVSAIVVVIIVFVILRAILKWDV